MEKFALNSEEGEFMLRSAGHMCELSCLIDVLRLLSPEQRAKVRAMGEEAAAAWHQGRAPGWVVQSRRWAMVSERRR